MAERYYNLGIENDIVNFIHSVEKSSVGKNEWFDPKQEICHTIGIILLLCGKETISRQKIADQIRKKKNIHLFNIYWALKGENDEVPPGTGTVTNFKRAFGTLIGSLNDKGILTDFNFDFDTFSIQNMISEKRVLLPIIYFPQEAIDKIKTYGNYVNNRTRKQM